MRYHVLTRRFGFARVGEFSLYTGTGRCGGARRLIDFDLASLPLVPAVYVVAFGNELTYIGSSCNLRGRVRDYCTHKGNMAKQREIKAALKRGERVQVLAYYPKVRRWNGFKISVVVAIEARLIGLYGPPWNMTKGDQGPRALRGNAAA